MMRISTTVRRWATRVFVAGVLGVGLAGRASGQFGFSYAVWQNYLAIGDGSPYSNLLCAGTTAVINYDNNPLTSNPKIQTWCPPIGPAGDDFGAQFGARLFAPTDGLFQFYVGSDDGSALFIDGIRVMQIPGEQPFSSATVLIPFLAGSTHTYQINYYANNFGGSAIQATVDSRLDVSPEAVWQTNVTATPEPATLLLLGSGLGGLGAFRRLRRRKNAAA